MNLIDIRQFFAEEIQAVANIQTKALVEAFAKVPREHFLGPGPWQIAYLMIFPCIGSRDEQANQQLRDAMKLGTWGSVQSLRREAHEPSGSCWLHGDNFCLSTLPVAASSGLD